MDNFVPLSVYSGYDPEQNHDFLPMLQQSLDILVLERILFDKMSRIRCGISIVCPFFLKEKDCSFSVCMLKVNLKMSLKLTATKLQFRFFGVFKNCDLIYLSVHIVKLLSSSWAHCIVEYTVPWRVIWLCTAHFD